MEILKKMNARHQYRRDNLGLGLVLLLCSSLIRAGNGFSPRTTIPSKRIAQTRLCSSSDGSGGGGDNDFMSSLRERVDQVSDRETKLPLVVLDSMLPRQVLRLQVNNPVLMELVRSRLEAENPHFGMLGTARLSTGQSVFLKAGVEVQILDSPEFVDAGVKLALRGGRRFLVEGEVDSVEQGWTEGRVKFLPNGDTASAENDDKEYLDRAVSEGRRLTSLVDGWIELARENEREPGQIDNLLLDLGEMPPPEELTDLAFFVGALINPIPAMGVAMEVRPALLTAETANERMGIALDGIERSIGHMNGTARMW